MKALSRLGAVALLASSASFAQAESQTYAGISSVFGNYDISGASEVDLNYVQAQLGYQFNDNFAVETRLGVGVGGNDSFNGTLGGIDYSASVEGKNIISVFAKGIIPLGPVDLYGLAGWTQIELELDVDALGVSVSEGADDSDFSYGIGVSHDIDETVGVFIEYMNFYDKDGTEITGWTLGLNAKF